MIARHLRRCSLATAWLVACVLPAATMTATGATPGTLYAAGQPSDSMSLGPTSEPPWNPPRPAPSSLPWEAALRLPGRIATLPVSALGQLTRRTLLVVEDRSLVPRVIVLLNVLPAAGVVIAPASLGDRTGLGATVGYAPPWLGRHVEAEYSGSTRDYSRTRGALVAGSTRLEYRYDWRPQERFYGFGMSSDEDDTTSFSATIGSVMLSHAHQQALDSRSDMRAGLEGWTGLHGVSTGRGREEDVTPIEAAHPGPFGTSPHFGSAVYWRVGGALVVDRRRGRPHWSSGQRVAVFVERSMSLEGTRTMAGVPSSRDASSTTRYQVEAEAGLSFWRDPRTFRLLLRGEHLEPDDPGGRVPLSELPTLGGSAGLAGFEAGRFRDHTLGLGRLSYIFPLAQHFELDVHAALGGVFSGVEAMRLSESETSYGVMLRPRTNVAPLGALGVEWGREKVRVRFSIGGVE